MDLNNEQLSRYSRNIALKEVRQDGQKKLLSSSVLVIGAGALGSATITYLTSAGVGKIGICDYDVVELSNLQRQVIHSADNIGEPKVLSAARWIKAHNTDVKVETYQLKVSSDNITQVIQPYDFVLDCTDRFETKFLINDACVLYAKPYCHAGVMSFCGQVMTYVPKKGPCLRCILGEVPKYAPSAKEVGVLGAVAGIIGSIQATEAIKFLLGQRQLLMGRVLSFDGLNMDIRVINCSNHDRGCAVCGENPTITSLQNSKDYETK